MFPYFSPPDSPYEQGRPPSRLEVQQQHLDQIRQRNRELSRNDRQPSMIPFGGLVLNLRRFLGGMLISAGNWMARESGRTESGPEALARR